MKKKAISGTTALAMLASATIPACASSMDLETGNEFADSKVETNKEVGVERTTSVNGVTNNTIHPQEHEWKKFSTIEDLRAIWAYNIETKKDGTKVLVLDSYLAGYAYPKVEIPSMIDGMPVELKNLDTFVFPAVTHIRVAKENGVKPKLRVRNLDNSFVENNYIRYLDLSGLDTTGLNSMRTTFDGCSNLQYVNLSGWDLSKVTDIYAVFYDCINLETIDFSGVSVNESANNSDFAENTPKLKNVILKDMPNKRSLNKVKNSILESTPATSITLDVTNLKFASDETTLDNMFKDSRITKIVGLETIDTSNITDMSNAFYGNTGLTSINVSGWDTSKVTTLESMFGDCENLTSIIGLDTWDVSKVSNFTNMFNETKKLKFLNLSSWQLKADAIIEGIFALNEEVEDGKFLVVTDDSTLQGFDFKGGKRVPVAIRLDANGGIFTETSGGDVTGRVKDRYYISSAKYNDIDKTIEEDIASLGTPTKEGYKFVEWEMTLDSELDMLDVTYVAKWEEVVEGLVIEMPNTSVRVGNTIEFTPKLKMSNGDIVEISMDENVNIVASNTNIEVAEYVLPDQTTNHCIFHIDGKVVGETELTLTYEGFTEKININVFDYELGDGNVIELDLNGNVNTEIKVNKVLSSGNIDAKDVTSFEIVDQSIAEVNGNVLTALKEGTTEIKVVTEGEEWNTITLKVVDTTVAPTPPTGDDNVDTEQPPSNDDNTGGDTTPPNEDVTPPTGDDNETEGDKDEDDSTTQPPTNTTPPTSGSVGGSAQPPTEESPEDESDKEKPNSPNGIEGLKDLDKVLQEKVDSIVAESVVEKQGLILNITGDSDDMGNIDYIEVTKDGIFAVVNGEKLKFGTSIEGFELDLDDLRAVRIDMKSKALLEGYSPVPHEITKNGLKINSNNLENILITSKVAELFADVNDNDWFKADVEEAFNYGFTVGTGIDTYNPKASITRGEFATMIARALELETINGVEFTDVEGKWYQNEVQALKAAGIVLGYENGTFGGDSKITRQEASKILLNALKYAGVDTTTKTDASFNDMDNVSGFAKHAVSFLAENGVLAGNGDNKFNPTDNLTRAEMAKILVQSLRLTDLY